MPSQEPLPWNRLPEESDAAYAAFVAFRDLGARRTQGKAFDVWSQAKGSKKKALKGPRKPISGCFKKWVRIYRWVDRATAWDEHCQRQEDDVAAETARKWEMRRQCQADRDWEVTIVLHNAVAEIAKQPVRRKKRRSKDGKTIIIEPMSPSTLKDAATALKIVRDIQTAILDSQLRPEGLTDPGDMKRIATETVQIVFAFVPAEQRPAALALLRAQLIEQPASLPPPADS